MTRISLFLLLILSLAPGFAIADTVGGKTDIIYLRNGDRVTGEVIRLEAGLLEFNTDTMGRTYIEWRFISEIISEKSQRVETVDGSFWLGRLEKPEEGDHIIVNTVRGPVDLAPEDVVSVWPVAATFWDRVDLDTALGFDYAQSTEIMNFTLSVDFEHTSDDRITDASLRSDITTQPSGDDQHRNELKFSHNFLLPEQRFRSYFASGERNDALGVDLRINGGAGVGQYFLKTNRQWLSLTGGLGATNETSDDGINETNLEGLGSFRYRYFRFAEPERAFDTTISIFPSITDWGRVRADLRSTFRLEFFRDLFWSMEFYATYDSDPLSDDAESSDYGIVTSLGWSL